MNTVKTDTVSYRAVKLDRAILGHCITPIVECLENRRLLSGGDVDASFGVAGTLTGQITLPGPSGLTKAIGDDLAVQNDGKIVVAGSIQSSGRTFMLAARFNSDGTIDPTFNGSGFLTVDFGSGLDAQANCVKVDSSGRIVIAGFVTAPPNPASSFAVARITATGKLDTTFSSDGRATVDFGQEAVINGLAVMSDGRVVVGGFTRSGGDSGEFAVARFTSSGGLDTGFGVGGKQVIDIAPKDDVANAVAVMPDGRVVLGGYLTQADGNRDMAVVRLTSSGQLDNTFNGDGIAALDFDGYADRVESLLLLSGGQVLVGGQASVRRDPPYDYIVDSMVGTAQFTSNGSLDPSFGIAGKTTERYWVETNPSHNRSCGWIPN